MTWTSRNNCVPTIGCLLLAGAVNLYAEQSRCVALLMQGMGPVSSGNAAEHSWGSLEVDAQGRFCWSDFIGFTIARGQRFGGVLRSRSEQVTVADLDTLGAADNGTADFFLLASSITAQEDGLESRVRELATAVAAVQELSRCNRIRLVCYSASGLAARLWMQRAVDGEIPEALHYRQGAVSHLITIATPHLGIGGAVGPVGRTWKRYAPLTPGSAMLRSINDTLDLPADVRYTSVVIQGTGSSFFDAGRSYHPYQRLSQQSLEALPPLMRYGHDGVVHALSAQLHLTPAAARYENATDRPVEVQFCRLSQPLGDRPADAAIHTQALRDPRLWGLLNALMTKEPIDKFPEADGGALASDQLWPREIALHLAELHVQRRHLAGRIRRSEVQALINGPDGQHWRWQCQCDVDVPIPLGNVRSVRYTVRGAFALTFDRFARPERLFETVVEVD